MNQQVFGEWVGFSRDFYGEGWHDDRWEMTRLGLDQVQVKSEAFRNFDITTYDSPQFRTLTKVLK